MYYSAIGVLAMVILILENQDILFKRNDAFDVYYWKVYRRFLFAVLCYYVTDIVWGILEQHKLIYLLFADTSLYFIAMAVGIVLWSHYAVAYLEGKNRFYSFILRSGQIMAAAVIFLSVLNIFVPVMFIIDDDCVYRALAGRYAILVGQIVILTLLSIYTFGAFFKNRGDEKRKRRYRTIAMFGLIMALVLSLQTYFPYLPMYAIAFLLGTCLIRAYVIGDEKEEYRHRLKDSEKSRRLQQTITALLDNMPALSFYKDAESGVYLACNQAFSEYAKKEKPSDVVGLTDAEIFDPLTAAHFVEDDRMALSMDSSYIFFEDVKDGAGNSRQLQTTKLKFYDADGKLCILGMCQDVTDMVRVQRENAMTKEAYEKAKSNSMIFSTIAQTLALSYEDLYYINIETGEFIEFLTDEQTGTLKEVQRGSDFFTEDVFVSELNVYTDDLKLITDNLKKDSLMTSLGRSRTFMMTYRRNSEKGPVYVSLKITRMAGDKRFITLGVTNVDEEKKQQRAFERMREERIAYGRLNALIGDFLCVYVIDLDTGSYREFSCSQRIESLKIPGEGDDIFEELRKRATMILDPEDVNRFLALFTRQEVLSGIERNGMYSITLRMIFEGSPNYIQLKAALVDEKEGSKLVVGINDIDDMVRQEKEYARRLEQARSMAKIDALTGVRNKLAFQEEENKMDRMISDDQDLSFALVILDVNDL